MARGESVVQYPSPEGRRGRRHTCRLKTIFLLYLAMPTPERVLLNILEYETEFHFIEI